MFCSDFSEGESFLIHRQLFTHDDQLVDFTPGRTRCFDHNKISRRRWHREDIMILRTLVVIAAIVVFSAAVGTASAQETIRLRIASGSSASEYHII